MRINLFFSVKCLMIDYFCEDNIMLNLVNFFKRQKSATISIFFHADKNWISLLRIYQMKLSFLCHLFMKGFVRRKSLSRRKSEINTQFLVPPLAILFFVRTLHIKDIFELCNPLSWITFSHFFPFCTTTLLPFLRFWMMTWKYFSFALLLFSSFFSSPKNIEQCSKVRKR